MRGLQLQQRIKLHEPRHCSATLGIERKPDAFRVCHGIPADPTAFSVVAACAALPISCLSTSGRRQHAKDSILVVPCLATCFLVAWPVHLSQHGDHVWLWKWNEVSVLARQSMLHEQRRYAGCSTTAHLKVMRPHGKCEA